VADTAAALGGGSGGGGGGGGGWDGTLTQLSYSRLLTRPGFWRMCTGEKVLVFQADAALCAPHALRPRVEDFFQWDYVGAPWYPPRHPPRRGEAPYPGPGGGAGGAGSGVGGGAGAGGAGGGHADGAGGSEDDEPPPPLRLCGELSPGYCVGNGGLSLRTRAAMLQAAEAFAANRLEDQFFALHLPLLGYAVAPEGEAKHFSVETRFGGGGGRGGGGAGGVGNGGGGGGGGGGGAAGTVTATKVNAVVGAVVGGAVEAAWFPVGVHAPQRWLTPAELERLYQVCPNARGI
jgi:hypothetical protein